MTIFGYSGARTITSDHRGVIHPLLTSFTDSDEFVTGACTGADATVARTLARLYPDAKHTVIVPTNRDQVEYWWLYRDPVKNLELIFLPPGTSYRDRNCAIVNRVNHLFAFPMHPEMDLRSRRSGTWQTVRLARRAGIDTTVHVLSTWVPAE